jgi:hypothetical protein
VESVAQLQRLDEDDRGDQSYQRPGDPMVNPLRDSYNGEDTDPDA